MKFSLLPLLPLIVGAVSDNPFACTFTASKDPETCFKSQHNCVWCRGKGLPGICVSEKQSQALIIKIPGVDCFGPDDHDQEEMFSLEDPYDVACWTAGMNSEDAQGACDAATDSQGQSCRWCDGAGIFGLCLSSEQAEKAAPYLDCDARDEPHPVANLYDPSCFLAAYQAGNDGENVCFSSQDADGDACAWCTYQDQLGVCLNQDQANYAQQWLDCAEPSEDVQEQVIDENPYDATCVMAGMQGDADSCKSTQDQDGQNCVYCPSGEAKGVCLTQEQAQIAEQFGIDCETLSDNPYDITCALAGYSAGDDGENVCKSTDDQDGAPCHWCTLAGVGQGICLTEEQAEIASQMNLDCSETAVSDPIPPTVKDCLKNVQEDGCNTATDENGDRCSWCNTVVGFGLCFSSEAREIAEQEFGMFFHCDDDASLVQ